MKKSGIDVSSFEFQTLKSEIKLFIFEKQSPNFQINVLKNEILFSFFDFK